MDKDELNAKANRLIYVKKSIAEFEEEEIEIKDVLEPHVGLVTPLLMPDGKIYLYLNPASPKKQASIPAFLCSNFIF